MRQDRQRQDGNAWCLALLRLVQIDLGLQNSHSLDLEWLFCFAGQRSYPIGFKKVSRGGSTQVKNVSSKDAPQQQLQTLAVILYGIQFPVKHLPSVGPPYNGFSSSE